MLSDEHLTHALILKQRQVKIDKLSTLIPPLKCVDTYINKKSPNLIENGGYV
jgi:hypothetical protein